MGPRVISINETVTPERAYATVTVQVDMADVEAFLKGCDIGIVAESAALRNVLDSAAALGKIADVESAASAAQDVADKTAALAASLVPRASKRGKGDE